MYCSNADTFVRIYLRPGKIKNIILGKFGGLFWRKKPRSKCCLKSITVWCFTFSFLLFRWLWWSHKRNLRNVCRWNIPTGTSGQYQDKKPLYGPSWCRPNTHCWWPNWYTSKKHASEKLFRLKKKPNPINSWWRSGNKAVCIKINLFEKYSVNWLNHDKKLTQKKAEF